MQLQDHEFTAWLDRLMEARKNRQDRRQRPYRNFRKPYNDGKQNGDQDQNHFCETELNQLKSWKCNKSWKISIVNMMM